MNRPTGVDMTEASGSAHRAETGRGGGGREGRPRRGRPEEALEKSGSQGAHDHQLVYVTGRCVEGKGRQANSGVFCDGDPGVRQNLAGPANRIAQ